MDRHPRFKGCDLFVFGESFAGHMAPNVASELLAMPAPLFKLKGLYVSFWLRSMPPLNPFRLCADAKHGAARVCCASASSGNVGHRINRAWVQSRGRRCAPPPTPPQRAHRAHLPFPHSLCPVGRLPPGSPTRTAPTRAIGDGWVEPATQNAAFPDYALSAGLIGISDHSLLSARAANCTRAIARGEYQQVRLLLPGTHVAARPHVHTFDRSTWF